jgi:hypothetical protein
MDAAGFFPKDFRDDRIGLLNFHKGAGIDRFVPGKIVEHFAKRQRSKDAYQGPNPRLIRPSGWIAQVVGFLAEAQEFELSLFAGKS